MTSVFIDKISQSTYSMPSLSQTIPCFNDSGSNEMSMTVQTSQTGAQTAASLAWSIVMEARDAYGADPTSENFSAFQYLATNHGVSPAQVRDELLEARIVSARLGQLEGCRPEYAHFLDHVSH